MVNHGFAEKALLGTNAMVLLFSSKIPNGLVFKRKRTIMTKTSVIGLARYLEYIRSFKFCHCETREEVAEKCQNEI